MNRCKKYLMNIAGSFLLAPGVYAFTIPFDIAVSGVTGISVSAVMYAIDTVIMLGQLPFGDADKVLYGAVDVYLMTYLIDRVLAFGVDKYRVTAVTGQYETLREIFSAHDLGVTLSLIETGLKRASQKAVVTTIRSRELKRVQDLIRNVDETAFATAQRVTDVRGRGYTLRKEIKHVADSYGRKAADL